MAEHMVLRSGDDQTLLMIAAASSDKMTFKACVEALRLAVTPHDVRHHENKSYVVGIDANEVMSDSCQTTTDKKSDTSYIHT